MKLLVVCSCLDLSYKQGCSPYWWQLLKGLYENGVDVVATTFVGKAIESPWWRTYPNPCYRKLELITALKEAGKKLIGRQSKPQSGEGKESSSDFIDKFGRAFGPRLVSQAWEQHIRYILDREKNVDAVVLFNIAFNYFAGLPTKIRKQYHIPFFYYDGDMPWSLPEFADEAEGRKMYSGADLTEYDGFMGNSEGGVKELLKLGAKKVKAVFTSIDPGLFFPLSVSPDKQDIDVFYYGRGYKYRREWMEKMLTTASREMPGYRFVLAGGAYEGLDVSRIEQAHDLPVTAIRDFCSRSKINVNIPRSPHASVYASATSRIFELAAMGCCIVSRPYNGLERWFEVGKEVIVVHNLDEAVQTYQELISHPKLRASMGQLARQRVLAEHTSRRRTGELIEFVRS